MCESADVPFSLFVKKEEEEVRPTAEVILTSTTNHKSANQNLQNVSCSNVLYMGQRPNPQATFHISTLSADGRGGLESFFIKSESSNGDDTGNTNDRNAYEKVSSTSDTVLGIPVVRSDATEHSANIVKNEKLDISGDIIWSQRNVQKCTTHVIVKTGDNVFQCKKCHKYSYTEPGIPSIRCNRPTEEHSGNTGDNEKVDISGGVIRSQRSFLNCTTHAIVKTGDNSFQCQKCQKPFKPMDTSHHRPGPRSRTCYTDQLKRQKPYKCDECDEMFGWESALVKHKRKHTGEKPFSCEVCGKKFTEKHYIRRHMRIHTGEKPFQCEECGRCFNRKNALIRHIPTHSGRQSKTKSNGLEKLSLRQALLQPREKTYMCEHCGLQLLSQYVLDFHIKLFHT